MTDALQDAEIGSVVVVCRRYEPNYRAVVEFTLDPGRLGVRPLAGQGVSQRRRTVWWDSILGVDASGESPHTSIQNQ